MSTDAVLLLWGESPYLLRLAAGEALGEVRPLEIDAEDWSPGATADLATPSLWGEARALLVPDAQRLSEDALAEIRAYADAPAPEARLVLAATVSARAKGPPAALSRALKGRAAIRRVAVERRDLPGWVASRGRARQVQITPPGAAALVETVGEDFAMLDRALEQLSAAFPGQAVTPDTVAAQFRGFGDRRVWELCDAAFSGDLPAAMRCLAGMLAARDEPLMILGGIAARLRDLVRVRSLPERMPPAELARAAELRFDWQARRYRSQARRFSTEELTALHAGLVDADRAMKVGAAGDVILPMLVTRIAGRPAGPAEG